MSKAYTRTKQPVVGGYADALDYNEETKLLEVGTNLYVDGNIIFNANILQPSGAIFITQGITKTGGDVNIKSVYGSVKVNDDEVITDIQAVIDEGVPQLNLKQGNNIVGICDLSPVLDGVPVNLKTELQLTSFEEGEDGAYHAFSNIRDFSKIKKILAKYQHGFNFSASPYSESYIYQLDFTTTSTEWNPYPAIYFQLSSKSITSYGSPFMEIYYVVMQGSQGDETYDRLEVILKRYKVTLS